MATSTIKRASVMTLDSDYTNFFAPVSGFTISTMTLRRVERNLYYVFLRGSFATDAITANNSTKIGDFDLSYFENYPISAYLPGYIINSANPELNRPGSVAVSVSGAVSVQSLTTVDCKTVIANGLFIRREV